MSIITHYINYKGGVNNMQICVVVNDRLERIKAFRSLKNQAEKRALKFINSK